MMYTVLSVLPARSGTLRLILATLIWGVGLSSVKAEELTSFALSSDAPLNDQLPVSLSLDMYEHSLLVISESLSEVDLAIHQDGRDHQAILERLSIIKSILTRLRYYERVVDRDDYRTSAETFSNLMDNLRLSVNEAALHEGLYEFAALESTNSSKSYYPSDASSEALKPITESEVQELLSDFDEMFFSLLGKLKKSPGLSSDLMLDLFMQLTDLGAELPTPYLGLSTQDRVISRVKLSNRLRAGFEVDQLD